MTDNPNPNPATLSPRQIQQCAEQMAHYGRWDASIAYSLLIAARWIVAQEERRELAYEQALMQLYDVDDTEAGMDPRNQG